MRWRIEADTVGGRPQIGGAPHLRESLVDAWRAANGRKGRVLEILHHDAVVVAAIPALRIVRTGADVLPQRLRRRLAHSGRNGVVQHDVAMLVPEREIGSGQHGVARLDGRERAAALWRRVGTDDRGIDARQAFGVDAAGGRDDPALERLKSRRGLAEIGGGLLQTQADGVHDQIVEVAIVHGGWRKTTLPRRHRPRPQALELIDAEHPVSVAGAKSEARAGEGSVSARDPTSLYLRVQDSEEDKMSLDASMG